MAAVPLVVEALRSKPGVPETASATSTLPLVVETLCDPDCSVCSCSAMLPLLVLSVLCAQLPSRPMLPCVVDSCALLPEKPPAITSPFVVESLNAYDGAD